jgi:fucose permease
MKKFLAASLSVFALVGVATTMLGPMLPILAAQWKLTDRQLGALFVAQFCGGFAGAIASTALIRRTSTHFTVRAGLLLTAAGIACVPWPSVWAVRGGIALYGIGIGLATPSISVGVCEVFRSQPARALNLLNFCWAIGAILAPGMILRLALHSSLGLRGTLLAASAILLAASWVIPAINATGSRGTTTTDFNARDLGLIISAGMLIFAYVGVENGVAGWLPTFVLRMHGLSPEKGALLQGSLWTALLIGRFLTVLFICRGTEHRFLKSAILMVTMGTAAMLFCRGTVWLFASVIFIGAGCAPIFPTTIAVLSQQFSKESLEKLGWIFAAGGLGGAVLPFFIGTLSHATASLRTGMCILLVSELGMFAMHAAMQQYCSPTVADGVPNENLFTVAK